MLVLTLGAYLVNTDITWLMSSAINRPRVGLLTQLVWFKIPRGSSSQLSSTNDWSQYCLCVITCQCWRKNPPVLAGDTFIPSTLGLSRSQFIRPSPWQTVIFKQIFTVPLSPLRPLLPRGECICPLKSPICQVTHQRRNRSGKPWYPACSRKHFQHSSRFSRSGST